MAGTAHRALENLSRARIALHYAQRYCRTGNVLAVGLSGSVARGEATKSSDVDLLVILRKARHKTRFKAERFHKTRVQIFFVTVGFLQKVFWRGTIRNWSEHRLATRLREMFLLFSKDPMWMMKLRLKLD